MTIQHSYENKSIRVSYDGVKCAHAGYCFGELKSVFDGDHNPPIDLNGAPIADIVRIVEKCPSSALTYERLDGVNNEILPKDNSATLIPNGPVAMRGTLTLDGKTYGRLTLCRCGKSQQKPFCDGSHHNHEFDDGKTIEIEGNILDSNGDINFTAYPDGPVGFEGNIIFKSIDNKAVCSRETGAICRCGASKSKPFCDGSHMGINFKS